MKKLESFPSHLGESYIIETVNYFTEEQAELIGDLNFKDVVDCYRSLRSVEVSS